ncbi:hypothetical protein ASG29_01740 [Sphingomonas sp. Leaf412]|nr:hypothetical protein ASG29_01740 [Sphingomonas sp. Leaf412]
MWLIAAAAAVVVGTTALLVVVLRLRQRRAMLRTPEEAAEAATAAIPGFAVHDAVIGDDGRAALVLGTDGRVVVVTAGGRAGAVPWAALRQTFDGVVVETGTRRLGQGRLGEVMLKGVHALDVRRLGMPLPNG